jgi:hypothetical protein
VKVISLMSDNPELRNRYKDPAETLSISYYEVQQIWGFIMANRIQLFSEII